MRQSISLRDEDKSVDGGDKPVFTPVPVTTTTDTPATTAANTAAAEEENEKRIHRALSSLGAKIKHSPGTVPATTEPAVTGGAAEDAVKLQPAVTTQSTVQPQQHSPERRPSSGTTTATTNGSPAVRPIRTPSLTNKSSPAGAPSEIPMVALSGSPALPPAAGGGGGAADDNKHMPIIAISHSDIKLAMIDTRAGGGGGGGDGGDTLSDLKSPTDGLAHSLLTEGGAGGGGVGPEPATPMSVLSGALLSPRPARDVNDNKQDGCDLSRL